MQQEMGENYEIRVPKQADMCIIITDINLKIKADFLRK